MNLIYFVLFKIIYQRSTEASSNQRYIDIKTGKILSEQLVNVSAATWQDCAGKCMSLEPIGACDLAGFNKSSSLCQLGSQGIGQIQDVLDENSVVLVFYKMCTASIAPEYGSMVSSVNRDTAYFTCDPGFILNGDASLPCMDGEWVGTPPTCTDIDECGTNPCLNGATCRNVIGNYKCSCVRGFTGTNCETDINECENPPCLNGGTCVNGIGSYTCTCSLGFTGVNCETDANACGSNPCLNGATCVLLGIDTYSCTCATGFMGVNCETDINECGSNPCVNGATCVNGIGMYTCSCIPGYTGTNCQTEINECGSNPCLNGGTCTDGIGVYTCSCVLGFTGVSCQTDINECGSNPCLNGATCLDGINMYTCTCAIGFTGVNCATDINECASNPCVNGATCVNGIGLYTCSCIPGYTGTNCQTDINECGSNPCLNGATCTNGIGMYTCSCILGFTGVNCETDINECVSNPCLNGATCINGVNMYNCSCSTGFSGPTCATGVPFVDCCDVRTNFPSAASGRYSLTMANNTVISVYCDMNTTCGGWTVIQRRFDGSLNFTQTFAAYENGFGNVTAEHWVGLKYIREIANRGPTKLRIDLEAADNSTAYEEHTNFFLAATAYYDLNVDPGTGTAGDGGQGMTYNQGYAFFASDRDNNHKCSENDFGGWWYNFCTFVNLNGRYMPPGDTSLSEGGVTYRTFKVVQSLRKTKMMISRCCP